MHYLAHWRSECKSLLQLSPFSLPAQTFEFRSSLQKSGWQEAEKKISGYGKHIMPFFQSQFIQRVYEQDCNFIVSILTGTKDPTLFYEFQKCIFEISVKEETKQKTLKENDLPFISIQQESDTNVIGRSFFVHFFGWTIVDYPMIERLCQLCLHLRCGLHEWGCGKGLICLLLAHEFHLRKKNFHVTGLDTFEEQGRPFPQFAYPHLQYRKIKRPYDSHEKELLYQKEPWNFKQTMDFIIDTDMVSVDQYDKPNPKEILLISWGRSLEYVVREYVKQGGICLVLIHEGADGCMYHVDPKYMSKYGYKEQNYPVPNFPGFKTSMSVFSK